MLDFLTAFWISNWETKKLRYFKRHLRLSDIQPRADQPLTGIPKMNKADPNNDNPNLIVVPFFNVSITLSVLL